MTATTPKLYIQDVTLRDGMHAMRHQYSLETVVAIAKALDAAKVDAIEITHGDGVAGGSFNYGFGSHTDHQWIEAVSEVLTHAVTTVLLVPGIGTKHDLKDAYAGNLDIMTSAALATADRWAGRKYGAAA